MKNNIDKLDVDKLKPLTTELSMLSDDDHDEHDVHDVLVKNVNAINISRLAKKIRL